MVYLYFARGWCLCFLQGGRLNLIEVWSILVCFSILMKKAIKFRVIIYNMKTVFVIISLFFSKCCWFATDSCSGFSRLFYCNANPLKKNQSVLHFLLICFFSRTYILELLFYRFCKQLSIKSKVVSIQYCLWLSATTKTSKWTSVALKFLT